MRLAPRTRTAHTHEHIWITYLFGAKDRCLAYAILSFAWLCVRQLWVASTHCAHAVRCTCKRLLLAPDCNMCKFGKILRQQNWAVHMWAVSAHEQKSIQSKHIQNPLRSLLCVLSGLWSRKRIVSVLYMRVSARAIKSAAYCSNRSTLDVHTIFIWKL